MPPEKKKNEEERGILLLSSPIPRTRRRGIDEQTHTPLDGEVVPGDVHHTGDQGLGLPIELPATTSPLHYELYPINTQIFFDKLDENTTPK